MKKPLSDKELAAFVFMKDYFKTEDMLPSQLEVSQHVGSSYPSSGHAIYLRLAQKGYLERNKAGRFRFTREQEAANA